MGMMINIDQRLAVFFEMASGTAQFSAIKNKACIKTLVLSNGVDHQRGAGQKSKFSGQAVLIIGHNLFAHFQKSIGQSHGRSKGITVRVAMGSNQKSLPPLDGAQNCINHVLPSA